MAFFAVTIETIDSVGQIPEADRIQVAKLQGKDFQFVIGKDSFKPGDRCLYFPVDSLLPEGLITKMGLTGKLSGKLKNRIKTVKLRGQISQGIVAGMDILAPELREVVSKFSPDALTQALGVTKYDPPENVCNDGILKPLPDGLSMYDIEGADRYTEIAALLMDKDVAITEKLEGTNSSVCVKKDGTVFVNCRKNTIIELPDVKNMYWKVVERQGLIEMAKKMMETLGEDVTIYGELIGPGIQKNIYELKEHQIRVFDVKIGYKWMPVEPFVAAFRECTELLVPRLWKGKLSEFLGGRTIKLASDGMSVLNPKHLREGIVIRPLVEEDVPQFGRLIIKQRSAEYLAKNDT